MRAIYYLGATTLLAVGLTIPAPAQMMCGPGQQGQGQSGATSSGGGMMMGGMCGMMGQRTADDPMADPSTQPQRQGMMCPCCRDMTMMRPQQQSPAQPRQ